MSDTTDTPKKKPQYTLMKDLQGYITAEDVDKILQQVLNTPCQFKERNYLFILMLFRTGRRVSELLKLNVADINFMQKGIIWNILKKRTKTQRLKSVDSETFQLLSNYIEINEKIIETKGGLIFPFKRAWAQQLVQKYCEEAGYNLIGTKKPHPHHFRHSFSIHYLTHTKRNEALSMLQKELEHSNINITQLYLQFNLEDARKVKEEVFLKKKKEENG
jgi:integrase